MSDPTQTLAYADFATFADYEEAQSLVDRLSDAGFDVAQARIVGRGLRSVEYVTGRLTVTKAALAHAASGAWFGLFAGGLLTFFSSSAVWVIGLLAGLLVGAVAGGLYGAIGHALTRGRRDFSSFKTVEASSYAVMLPSSSVGEASRLVHL